MYDRSQNRFFAWSLIAASAMSVHPALAGKATARPAAKNAAAMAPPFDETPLTQDEKARHVLDRLGFGPRPGDIERVKQMGLHAYIDEQLHPERIPDDTVMQELSHLSTLNLSLKQLEDGYRQGQQQARQLKLQKQKIDDAAKGGAAVQPAANPLAVSLDPPARKPGQAAPRAFGARVVGELQMAKAIRASESNRQLQEVMVDFWNNHFNIDVRKGLDRTLKTADDRDVIRPNALGKFRDLLEASAKSPAMLFYLDNARSSVAQPARPAFARNRRRFAQVQRAVLTQPAPQMRGGINENYGREIMELHTLGVDGGYTQKDVQEVARCFTGWRIDPQTGGYRFYPRRHDDGEKAVLGHTIPAGGGEQDGETVLNILAAHPATAHFIAHSLCQRFVSDNPPKSVVDAAAATFTRTNGDIREVMATIIASPEFFSRDTYRKKIKSPFEFAVSGVRALGAHLTLGAGPAPRGARRLRIADNMAGVQALGVAAASFSQQGKGQGKRLVTYGNRTLVGQVAQMGQPLFMYQAPTGYSEDSTKWVNAGALIARMNFALTLTHGRVADVSLPDQTLADATSAGAVKGLQDMEKQLLLNEVSPATHGTLLKEATDSDKPADGPTLAALVLGSPEFQRR